MELHARGGRAVLVGYGDPPVDPRSLDLPEDLVPALHEWAQVAESVRRAGSADGEPGELVSRRGRQLAVRLAADAGVPVGYADPIGGGIELVRPIRPEATPWATGIAIATATAIVVAVALIALSQALAAVGSWLVVVANAVAAAGLGPSVWLARATPVWRWIAYGVPIGILATWLIGLLSLLGPSGP